MIDPRGEADGFISDYWLTNEQSALCSFGRSSGSATAYLLEPVLELDRASRIMRELLRLLAERDGFPTEVDE